MTVLKPRTDALIGLREIKKAESAQPGKAYYVTIELARSG